MSTSPFQISGVASGIGWDEIIDKLISVGRKPAEQWQSKIDTLEFKRSLYQEVTSSIYSLRSTMTSLKLPSAYKKKTAEWVVRSPVGTDASNVVNATVNANAEIASWNINVKQLATAQQHVSNKFDPSTALGISGKVRIQVGMQVAFLEVETDDTIRTINQKINQLTGPDGSALAVTAKLIDNRLVIESSLTGLDTEGPLSEVSVTMYESLYEEITDNGETLKQYQTYLPQPASGSSFPTQLFLVKSGDTTYIEGMDYTYDAENGVITWLAKKSTDTYTPKHPADGAQIDFVTRGNIPNISSGSGDTLYANYLTINTDFSKIDLMPTLTGGVLYNDLPYELSDSTPVNQPPAHNTVSDPFHNDYDPDDPTYDPAYTEYVNYMSKAYVIADSTTGIKYQYGKDYTFDYLPTDDGTAHYQVIKWNSTMTTTTNPPTSYTLFTGLATDYTVNHRQLHLVEDDMTSSNSVLAQLGITTIKENPNDPNDKSWEFTEGQFVEAQDAILTLNGVTVTRSTNTIPVEDDESDALIANVKLELTGVGDVTMNIVQDATEVIENLQTFVDAYNDLMDLINYRLEEKYDSNTVSDDDDYLQSILSASKGTTTFGVLHGDQLLWSVKNQMRRYFTDSITSLSTDLRSRKFLHPASALSMQGSFYVNVGAKVARIDVSPDDSLEAVQRKLNYATAINGTDGSSASGRELGLEVDIVDGQLVIKTASTVSGTGNEDHTFSRASGQSYEQLSFVPDTSPPINGVMNVYQGDTTYEENVDYKLETYENSSGVLESRIVWLGTGKSPSAGSTYNIAYEYDAAGVGFTEIPNTGDLSGLDLHYDSSKIQLSSLGFTTESTNYGKSGLMEFDQDVFFEAIKEDPDMVSNVMLAFMDKMDTYIGNLVDSSNVIVGGTIVTKGRFAAALNSIDTEVASLNEQITKLEKQLEQRQTALYKQYSDMEQAIQTLNAQMSSMSQYFSNQSSS